MVIAATKSKDACSLEKLDIPRQHTKKHFADKVVDSPSCGFSSSHVWMWESDHKEVSILENQCFQTVVLEKTLESPLDCKETKPVNPKGNQAWIFIGRTNAKAPIFWPPDAKSRLIRKHPVAGKDWGQEEKGMTEDEIVGWHHWLNGHEFEYTLGDGEGQGSLACSPRDHKELDMAEQLNNYNKTYIWLPRCLSAKESASQSSDSGNTDSIPASGRSPGAENGNQLQYPCLEILWTEEPDGLQSMGSQGVTYDWTYTHANICTHAHIYKYAYTYVHIPTAIFKSTNVNTRDVKPEQSCVEKYS